MLDEFSQRCIPGEISAVNLILSNSGVMAYEFNILLHFGIEKEIKHPQRPPWVDRTDLSIIIHRVQKERSGSTRDILITKTHGKRAKSVQTQTA